MKKLLIYVLFLFCFVESFSQSIVNRGNAISTVQDARLSALLNFFIPKYADTTAANLNKGIDTCGAIIYTYLGNRVWVRGCSPKQWVSVGSRFGYPSEDVLADGNRRFNLAGYKMYLDSGSLILNAEVFPTSDTAFAVRKGISDLLRVSGVDGITYINSINSQTFTTYSNFAHFAGGFIQQSGNVINLAYQQPFYITRTSPLISPSYGLVLDNDTTGASGIDSNDYYIIRANYTTYANAVSTPKFTVSGAGTIYAANYPHSGDQDTMLVAFNGQIAYRTFVEIAAALGSGSGGGTLANVGSGYWAAITGTTNVKTFLAGPAAIIDSATANSLRFSVDTNSFYPRLWNPSGYITDTNLHLSYLYPLYAADDTTLAIDTSRIYGAVSTKWYVDSLLVFASTVLGGNSGVNLVGTNIQLGQSALLKHTSISGDRLFNLTIDSSNFIVKGVLSTGQTIPSYIGPQMFFYPRKGAFRAGYTGATEWNDANIGFHSAAFNFNNTASATASTAFGDGTIVSGRNAIGGGSNSVVSAWHAGAFGAALTSKSRAGFVIGAYNDSTNSASLTSFDVLNRAFQIGIGQSDASRANAMTVLFSGNVGIGILVPVKIFHTVGTVRHASLGTMTFDTTLRKPLTIDAAGDIASGFWAGSGGGAGNTIYTADDALAGNRVVSLAGNTLSLADGAAFFSNGLHIDPTPGAEQMVLQSHNTTAGDNDATVFTQTLTGVALVSISAVFNGGATTATFDVRAETGTSSIVGMADSIIFYSDSFYINSTLGGTSNGWVWTIINPVTGSGHWAANAVPGIDDVLGVGQQLTTDRFIDANGHDFSVGFAGGIIFDGSSFFQVDNPTIIFTAVPPTFNDTTNSKILVRKSDGSISISNWSNGGGVGSGNTIYSGDDFLTGNRIVDLNTVTLSFQEGGNNFLSIDPTTGAESTQLVAYNTTGGTNIAGVVSTTTNAEANTALAASFNGGAKLADVTSFANATISKVTVTADSFYLAATLSGTSVGYVWTLVNPTDGSGKWEAAAGGGLTVGTTTITSGTTTRILYDNAGVLGEYTITGSGTVVAMQTAPTFVTSITSPLVLGGTGTTDDLILQSTSGVAASGSVVQIKTGNNGALTAYSLNELGSATIGSTAAATSTVPLIVTGPTSHATYMQQWTKNATDYWAAITQSGAIRFTNDGTAITGNDYAEIGYITGVGGVGYVNRSIDADIVFLLGASTTEALRIKSSYGLGWSSTTATGAASDAAIGRNTTRQLYIEGIGSSGTNAVARPFILRNPTSGTPVAGMGTGMEYQFENGSGTQSVMMQIDAVSTDVTAASEDADFVLLLKDAGTLTESFRIDSDGKPIFRSTVTGAGTTGAQTINKASGTVNFATAATTLVVTNSLVTVNSIVFCVIRTADATAVLKSVVPAAGSFTITLNAGATGETSVGFLVIN